MYHILMGNLDVIKTLSCNDGDTFTVIFTPNGNYHPQTALTGSSGTLAAYIDNMFITNVSVSSMITICNELGILDFENYDHANLVILGLVKTLIRR